MSVPKSKRKIAVAQFIQDASSSMEELMAIRDAVHKGACSIGLSMSRKKDSIATFRHHGLFFLKMRVGIVDGRKAVFRIGRKGIRSARRKLKIFRRWVDDGKMAAEDAFSSYQSWRAHARRAESYDTLQSMDEFFARIFRDELLKRKLRFPCTLMAFKTSDGWEYRRIDAGKKHDGFKRRMNNVSDRIGWRIRRNDGKTEIHQEEAKHRGLC